MDKITQLKQLLQTNQQDCFLLHALGLEYLKINDINQAISYFEKVIVINENYVGTYYHLANAYTKNNETEKAINCYNIGIEIAEKLKDQHAKSELQIALDEIIE